MGLEIILTRILPAMRNKIISLWLTHVLFFHPVFVQLRYRYKSSFFFQIKWINLYNVLTNCLPPWLHTFMGIPFCPGTLPLESFSIVAFISSKEGSSASYSITGPSRISLVTSGSVLDSWFNTFLKFPTHLFFFFKFHFLLLKSLRLH